MAAYDINFRDAQRDKTILKKIVFEQLNNYALYTLGKIGIGGEVLCDNLDVYKIVNYMLKVSRKPVPLWNAVTGQDIYTDSFVDLIIDELYGYMKKVGVVYLRFFDFSGIADADIEIIVDGKERTRFKAHFYRTKKEKNEDDKEN